MSVDPDKPEVKDPVEPETPPRDPKGLFTPKPKKTTPKTPPAEPAKVDKPKVKDALLDEFEAELLLDLKGKVDPKELEGLDQRTRIKMMKIMAKSFKTANVSIDPTAPAPPTTEKPIPTILERNNADEYRQDILVKSSYMDIADELRGKKK